VDVLIEGFDADAVALARLLAAEDNAVRIAGPEPEPDDATELREIGIDVQSRVDLDADPGEAEIAYLDVWTPEVAPRVTKLRERGVRLSCLGDLLLERWRGLSIGITGTAGKTTTTALVAAVLRHAGRDVAVSKGARAGNLWPTVDLLERVADNSGHHRDQPEAVLLLELTSSHLAFMQSSPSVAAVISFWPDHLELHGSLDAYRAAKEQIVRHQVPGDRVVVNAADASVGFAAATPAEAWELSLVRPVERGAFLDRERGVVVTNGTTETALGHVEGVAHPANAVAAAAIATAAGVDPRAIAPGLADAVTPPWRAEQCGTLGGVPVVDDGMAATPMKSAATLGRYPAASVVLIAGGLDDAGGGPVHATPEEAALLEQACDVVARVARVVVLFGEAARRLAPLLERRRLEHVVTSDLDTAVVTAAERTTGAGVVVFSPLFPVALADRRRFGALVRRTG
jgi:UDP-N-acetylmuramoylalanine--D-glutamate ligase